MEQWFDHELFSHTGASSVLLQARAVGREAGRVLSPKGEPGPRGGWGAGGGGARGDGWGNPSDWGVRSQRRLDGGGWGVPPPPRAS